jgi:formylglycine-generating enzyme required for sulfatase activity
MLDTSFKAALMRGSVTLLATWGLLFAATAPAADPPKSKDLLKTFVEELVEIRPDGAEGFPKTYRRGSSASPTEQPVVEVTLTRPFWIAKYEVPQNLYEQVMGTNPSRWKGPRNSVEMMTWQEAQEFCVRLTARLKELKLIAEDEVIRLPTEAEWEYCCRAGTDTAYSFGDEARNKGDAGNAATILNAYAWHTGNAAGNDPAVGALKPNPWGLYDMHGYLWEFCADDWAPDYKQAPVDGSAYHGQATDDKTPHVIRSGSWKDPWSDLRSSSRRQIGPGDRDDAVGFRCVKSK